MAGGASSRWFSSWVGHGAALWLACWLFAAWAIFTPALAQKRVALVIGNGGYAKVPKLNNTGRDAAAIEAMLKAANFDVVQRVTDVGNQAMRRALRDFSDHVRDADIAVVFYAGHGIEMNGVNYLIPVDAVLERDIDVEDETITLDRVSQVLEQAKRLRLIILDACRDNPFIPKMKRTIAGRSIGRGLAKVDVVSSDTLIAYAAKAGSVASDGSGNNSPYTTALVKHLPTPGLDVRLAMGRVRDEVMAATGNRQEPFVYGSLGGSEIPLLGDRSIPPPQKPPEAGAPVPPASTAAREWQDVKDTTSVAVLEGFIRRHQNHPVYAELAQARIDSLKRQRQAVLDKAAEDAAKLGGGLHRIQTGPSLWEHNGSTMRLIADGSKRQFVYESPRAAILEAGAGRGELLFEGERKGLTMYGRSHIFRAGCGKFAYAVSGTISADERRIELFGERPHIDERCRVSRTSHDRLVFEYLGQ